MELDASTVTFIVLGLESIFTVTSMCISWSSAALALLPLLTLIYLSKLSNRLQGPCNQATPFTKESLEQTTYNDIDLLKSVPSSPTSLSYTVIGGSGFLGTCIVRLLLLRGETNIRILDLDPPSIKIASNPAVSFVKTDITSLESIREALRPFDSTSARPSVIYHTAAIIRFWERLSYCWDASYDINVQGVKNVITAAQELPSAILIYTSTCDTVIPRPKFLRLGWDLDNAPSMISDSDQPLSPLNLSQSCYSRTKLIAEELVVKADNLTGLRAGVIRPGYAIIGPNDRLVTSTLIMSRVPVWDKHWSSTNICVWDAAAAHLLLEDALIRDVKEARGQAFLVTGKDSAWRLQDTRDAVKHFATRPVILNDVPPLLMFILAHLVEALLFVRYHALLFLFFPLGIKPRLVPKWMGQLVYLQPTTLEYLSDIVLDDSRARKILGYRPQWSNAQCIRYAVDEVESGNTGTSHGLQLKSFNDS
ncbi:hypothetical protein D9615_002977 [Tricholomella constricta]|uniref:3-beta hydroxysteroid dehydrogenase/isomerase domain-containing protein n=1 Tax=Tricholomella constricta TaxID=117010 RepID=A0A8H5M6A1_9AGAR|nr:hypothetical protein D9615_002977 [Tricholomella constricta]